MLFYRALCFCLLLLLPGCFKPLHHYGSDSTAPYLSNVKISDIEGPLGYHLRHELIHALTPYGQPAKPDYILTMKIKATKSSLGILKDATASRHVSKITASYQLLQANDGKIVVSGSTPISSNYSVISPPRNKNFDNTSHYRTIVAQEDAEKRALKELAQNIKIQLVMALERQKEDQRNLTNPHVRTLTP